LLRLSAIVNEGLSASARWCDSESGAGLRVGTECMRRAGSGAGVVAPEGGAVGRLLVGWGRPGRGGPEEGSAAERVVAAVAAAALEPDSHESQPKTGPGSRVGNSGCAVCRGRGRDRSAVCKVWCAM